MASIADLSVKLGLSANGFFSTINKVKSELSATKSWTSKLVSGFGGIKTALAGLGLAGSTAVFASFIRSNLEGVDSLSKLSTKLGVSTEALGKLKYAGELANIPLETLGAGVAKMNKNLGEAVNGSETAQAAFSSLGLDFTKLATMAPDEALGVISDRLNQLENPAQRTAAILDIFGKSGLELNGILSLGSQGLAEYGKEAERLGLTFSAIDGTQVENANDSFTKLLSLLTAVGQRIAIELAPFIRQLNSDILDFATQGGGATQLVSNGFAILTDTISYVGNAIDLLKIPFYSMRAVFTSVIGVGAKQLEYLLLGLRKVAELAGADSLAASIKDFENTAGSFGNGLFETAQESAQAIVDVFTGPQAGEKVKKWFDAAKKNSVELAQVAKQTGRALDESLLEKFEEKAGKATAAKAEEAGKKLESIFSGLQDQLDNLNLSPVDALAKKIQEAGGDFFDILDGWKILGQIEESKAKKLATENRKKSFEKNAELASKGVEFISVNSNRGQAMAAGYGSSNSNPELLEAKRQTQLLVSIARNTTPELAGDEFYEGL